MLFLGRETPHFKGPLFNLMCMKLCTALTVRETDRGRGGMREGGMDLGEMEGENEGGRNGGV